MSIIRKTTIGLFALGVLLLLTIILQWQFAVVRYAAMAILASGALLLGTLFLQWRFNAIKFGEHVRWGIAVYQGNSPIDPKPQHSGDYPVLSKSNVSDVRAKFIADPFVLREGDNWWMFTEVYNLETDRGEIALAYSSDGYHWDYQRVVLAEPFHLSYPFVFKYHETYFMMPETGDDNSVWLYRGEPFPTRWIRDTQLLAGEYIDSTLIHFEGRWWLFTSDKTMGNLYLFYADDPRGPYTPHAKNPVIKNNRTIARPSGRMLIHDGRLIRYAQQDEPKYGMAVRALEVTTLTADEYEEHLLGDGPILSGTEKGWNSARMHHIDPIRMDDGSWRFIVDGGGGNKHFPLVDAFFK